MLPFILLYYHTASTCLWSSIGVSGYTTLTFFFVFLFSQWQISVGFTFPTTVIIPLLTSPTEVSIPVSQKKNLCSDLQNLYRVRGDEQLERMYHWNSQWTPWPSPPSWRSQCSGSASQPGTWIAWTLPVNGRTKSICHSWWWWEKDQQRNKKVKPLTVAMVESWASSVTLFAGGSDQSLEAGCGKGLSLK